MARFLILMHARFLQCFKGNVTFIKLYTVVILWVVLSGDIIVNAGDSTQL